MKGIGVIVYGPEASGTRYVTQMLDATGGCVRHCSLPMGAEYPALHSLMAMLDHNDTRVVITSRRTDALIKSQIRAGHVQNELEAITNIHRAYTWAIGECSRMSVPYLLTSYSNFEDPEYRVFVARWALDTIDEDAVRAFEFVDGDTKYGRGSG